MERREINLMPKLSSHPRGVKLALLGDSGSGKTGALASLAFAGRELFILDFDNGLDILTQLLRSNPAALDRVRAITLTDKLKSIGGQILPDGVPTAFSRAMNLLTNWTDGEENLGPLTSWPAERVLVIDSGSFMSKAAFRWMEALGVSKDARAVYGEAQKRIENCIALLCSDQVKCSVIVTFHIALIDNEQGVFRGYPATIGRALGPEIPKYFNTVLQCRVRGVGASLRRVISTVPDGLVDLKAPVLPGSLPSELPLETGLDEFFKKLSGAPGAATIPANKP